MKTHHLGFVRASALVVGLWTAAAAGLSSSASAQLPSVVVVGAGMSGLAAANRLAAEGYPVVVLEARNRVGGRTLSVPFGSQGATVDLGASWIHGIHPAFQSLVSSLGIQTTNTQFTNMIVHDSLGGTTPIDQPLLDDLGFRFVDAILWNMFWAPELPVQDMVNIMWWTGNLPGYSWEFIQYATTAFFETEFAASSETIPVEAFWEWIPPLDEEEAWEALFGGGQEQNAAFPGGYNQVTDYLAQGLDIRLNTTVTNIDYLFGDVDISTTAGPYEADLVIVTVPIGVLKSGSIGFWPPLPSWKQGAINRMGSGVLNKLYLEFPYAFWEPDRDVLGISQPERGGLAVWVNMQRITGQPILMAFSSGQSAIDIEAMSAEDVLAMAMERLEVGYGPSIPSPINHKITKWNSDPYSRGSYSSFTLTTNLGDRDLLSQPVAGKVLFAGEATEDYGYAQVPGAYTSGLREAERIISVYGP